VKTYYGESSNRPFRGDVAEEGPNILQRLEQAHIVFFTQYRARCGCNRLLYKAGGSGRYRGVCEIRWGRNNAPARTQLPEHAIDVFTQRASFEKQSGNGKKKVRRRREVRAHIGEWMIALFHCAKASSTGKSCPVSIRLRALSLCRSGCTARADGGYG
jgi:hypothetical protein